MSDPTKPTPAYWNQQFHGADRSNHLEDALAFVIGMDLASKADTLGADVKRFRV